MPLKHVLQDGLPPKRAKFALKFFQTGNATQAAKAAGYSKKTAHMQGSRLLKNVKVCAAIERYRKNQLKRVEKESDEVVFLLEDQAYADRAEIWTEGPAVCTACGLVQGAPVSQRPCEGCGGSLMPGERVMLHPLDWPPALRRCIAGFKVVKRNAYAGDGRTDMLWDVKFESSQKAGIALGEHHGTFEKDRQQGREVQIAKIVNNIHMGPHPVAEARKRQ